MNRFKKTVNNKKGFTLTEIIVVLIIMAVLAAALIPSFLGFVNRANNERLLSEARVGMVAAQVVITEGGLTAAGAPAVTAEALNTQAATAGSRFNQLVAGDAPGTFSAFAITGNRVTGLTYTRDGNTVTIPIP